MKCGIGQDSHRFDFENKDKKLVIGGVTFEGEVGLQGNSDADVVLHAITNAISGVTLVNILGDKADRMCESGITDSREYLKEALKHLNGQKVSHVSISIECKRPKILPKVQELRESIAKVMGISSSMIGITATTGEGLTAFGKGEGIQAFCIVSVS